MINNRGLSLILISLSILLTSCPNNPAAPPAPPSELPSALRFPQTAGINVDKITPEPAAAPGALKAFVASGGKYSKEITFGANFAKLTNDFIDAALKPLTDFEIPVGTDIKTFENGTVKIDFADFDLDRDGSSEKCSGSTAALPICFRVWIDGKRSLAGRFDAFPTDQNPGAGRFRAQDETGILAGAVYDHQDPNNKTSEMFLLIGPSKSADGQPQDLFDTHSLTAQVGPDATASKTLRTSVQDRGLICGFSGDISSCSIGKLNTVKYIGRWREDNDFWSGTLENTFSSLQNFSGICARISTGDQDSVDDCLDLNIDVNGIDFLPFNTPEDVGFPLVADFPQSPTF